jgi:hypothetical protein
MPEGTTGVIATPAIRFDELVDAIANATSVAEVQRLRAELDTVIDQLDSSPPEERLRQMFYTRTGVAIEAVERPSFVEVTTGTEDDPTSR